MVTGATDRALLAGAGLIEQKNSGHQDPVTTK